jgi:3-oxoacyl-(acyl-carrier-protein) synthase
MLTKLETLGAQVALLMGSAYLFTHESVATKAILPLFQEVALKAQSTAVVHTAPGHATRCAVTPFVEAFESEKSILLKAGMPPKMIWEKMEGYNVGKLRIASKGKLRQDDQIIDIPQEEQFNQGMYMLGEVATLIKKTFAISDLHQDVIHQASHYFDLSSIKNQSPISISINHTKEAKSVKSSKIAIIGMACIFPSADDLDSYHHLMMTAKDAITEVPQERWDQALYYRQESQDGEYSNSKWGGFINTIPFEPAKYGIPPNTLSAVEPVQLLALEVAHRALIDAGLIEQKFDRKRTSVIFGAEAGTDLANAYSFRASLRQWLGHAPQSLESRLPKLTEDSFAGILANVISGRIANRLDLGGSNFTVDAACASSLAAVDLSIKELLYGESDLVLCGGADLHNAIQDYLMFSSVHALSATGKSKPFSQKADGIALGEGIAVLVLKRLDDALSDQNRIYAVIDGVGSSSDGKALGLTAPRKERQKTAIQRA